MKKERNKYIKREVKQVKVTNENKKALKKLIKEKYKN